MDAEGLAKEPINENDEEELMKNAMALAQEGGIETRARRKAMVRTKAHPSTPTFHKISGTEAQIQLRNG